MSIKAPSTNDWTDKDTDAMFATIGQYVVIFQWMEGKLDLILLLGWGHENWDASQAKLARMWNVDKVKSVEELVLKSPDFWRVHTRPDWLDRFRELIKRLHVERKRRNELLHSQFLFELVEHGGPPIQSKRRRTRGKVDFSQTVLTTAAQKTLLEGVTQLASDLHFTYVQLIHDYQAPYETADNIIYER